MEVRRSPVPVRLARLTPAPFTDRLVNKFDLPVVGWRGRAHELRAGYAARHGGAQGQPGAPDVQDDHDQHDHHHDARTDGD